MDGDIVCVHGIGYQLQGSNSILAEWRPALRDGIINAGGEPPNESRIQMAFYGKLFRTPGKKGDEIPPYDESDIVSEYERQLLKAWWLEGSRVDMAVPGPDDLKKGMGKVAWEPLGWTQRALLALSNSKFFSDTAMEAFIISDLKQVARYMTDETIRKDAQTCVVDVVSDNTRVLIGHSLGSVVAYEALCAHPEWHVNTFLTLGSPLGIPNLIFDRLRPKPVAGIGAWPGSLVHWINIAALGDIVALEKKLSSRFTERVQDFYVDNESKAHDARSYLTSKEAGNAIVRGLVS